MIIEDFQIQKEARKVVLSTLQQIPQIVEPRVGLDRLAKNDSADLLASFRKLNDRKALLIVAKSSGEPRLARAAINQLLVLQYKRPGHYGVFVAPYISERSAKICKSNGIGYIDFSGNCWLDLDSIYIEIKGNPSRFSKKSELKSLFAPKAERILRAILSKPGYKWSAMELAKSAEVSVGQVSNVRKLLLEREWIEDQKTGIKVIEPLQTLASWLAEYRPDRSAIYGFYDMNSAGDIEATISGFCKRTRIRYAFTSFSGASRYAPFTTYRTVTAYMDISAGNINELPFKPVTSGANIRIISPYDDGVFYRTRNIKDQSVVSPVQCYLDLKDEKARGEEASDALLEQVIKPSWQ